MSLLFKKKKKNKLLFTALLKTYVLYQDALARYVDAKVSGGMDGEDPAADPEAIQLLWSLLKIMYNHYGIAFGLSQRVATLIYSFSPSGCFSIGDLSQPEALKEVKQILCSEINSQNDVVSII